MKKPKTIAHTKEKNIKRSATIRKRTGRGKFLINTFSEYNFHN